MQYNLEIINQFIKEIQDQLSKKKVSKLIIKESNKAVKSMIKYNTAICNGIMDVQKANPHIKALQGLIIILWRDARNYFSAILNTIKYTKIMEKEYLYIRELLLLILRISTNKESSLKNIKLYDRAIIAENGSLSEIRTTSKYYVQYAKNPTKLNAKYSKITVEIYTLLLEKEIYSEHVTVDYYFLWK